MDSDHDKSLYNVEQQQERAREQARRAYRAKAAQLEPFTVRDAQGNVRSMNEPDVRRWIMSEQPQVYQQWIQTLETASKVERERKQQKVQEAVAAKCEELFQNVKQRQDRFKKNLSDRDSAVKLYNKAKSAQLTTRFIRVGDEQEKLKQDKNKVQAEMLDNTHKKLDEAGLRRMKEDSKKQEICKSHWNEIVTVVQERKRVLSATRREKIETMVLGNEKLEARLKEKEEKRIRRAARNQKRKDRRIKKNLKLVQKERSAKRADILGANASSVSKSRRSVVGDDNDGYFDEFDSDAESSELTSSSSEDEEDKRMSRKSSTNKLRSNLQHQQQTQFSHSPAPPHHHNRHGEKNQITASTASATKPSSPPVVDRLYYQSTTANRHASSRRAELLTKLEAHKHRLAAIEKKRQLYRSYTLAGSSRTMSLKQLTELAAAKREQVEDKRVNELNELPLLLRKDYEEHEERRQAYLDRVVEATKGLRKHQQEEIDRQNKLQQEADQQRREHLMSLLPQNNQKQSGNNSDTATQEKEVDLSQHISATDLDELEKCDPRILDIMLGENLKKQYLKLKEERDRAVEAARIQQEEQQKKEQQEWDNDANNRRWEAKTNPTDYAVMSREQDAERKKQKQEEQRRRQADAYARRVECVQVFRVRIDEESKRKERDAEEKRDMIQTYRVNELQTKRQERETVRERYYDGFHAKKMEQLAPFEDALRRPSFVMSPPTQQHASMGSNFQQLFGSPTAASDTPRQVESTVITRQPSQHQFPTFPSIPASISVESKSFIGKAKPDAMTNNNNNSSMKSVVPHPPLLNNSSIHPNFDPKQQSMIVSTRNANHLPAPITNEHNDGKKKVAASPSSSPPTATPQYEKSRATVDERREIVQEKLQLAKVRSAIFKRNQAIQAQAKKRRVEEKEEAKNNQVDKMYQDLSAKQNQVKKNLVEGLNAAEERRREALEEKVAKAKSYVQVHDVAKTAREGQQNLPTFNNNTARTGDTAPKFFVEKGSVNGIF